MRILILTLNFPPDGVSTSHLMGELAESLSQAGHDVCVITTTPHQSIDETAAKVQQIRRRAWSLVGRSRFDGIPVTHILMPSKAAGSAARLLQWLWFHAASTVVGWLQRRPDLIIAPSPPLTIGVNAWLIGRFGRTPVVYNVQELYPDVAVRLGYISNRTAIKLLKRLERLVYRLAAAVVVINPDMARSIEGSGAAPAGSIHVIPNFVDTKAFRPLPRDNDFSRKHSLSDKFVVSYAGNMGPAQGLDEVVAAAEALEDRDDIHFLLVGNGSEWQRLKEQQERRGLRNMTILPYEPYRLAPEIYASSDLCLVPLDKTLTTEALPSKVYKIMATGRPVLALTMEGSSLAHVVSEAGAGLVVPPGEVAALADAVRASADTPDQRRRYGEKGRAHVVADRSREAVMEAYAELFSSLVPAARA